MHVEYRIYIACSRNVSGCAVCSSKALSCLKCKTGYLLSNGFCISCPPQCAYCSSSAVCNVCIKGYILISDVCVASSESLTNCTSIYGEQCALCTPNSCSRCKTGYYLTDSPTTNNSCSQCSSACLTCTSASSCTACLSGYNTSNGVCIVCPSNCDACILSSNVTTCTKCAPNYSLKEGSCISCNGIFGVGCFDCSMTTCLNCSIGFYLKNTTCTKCSTNCNACYYNGACTECVIGYTLIQNSSASYCDLKCNLGSYYNSVTALCENCITKCSTCLGSRDCTSCESGYILQNVNKTISCVARIVCPDGQYLTDNNACLDCSISCLTCVNSITCISCISGMTLFKGACIKQSNCLATEYMYSDMCIKCSSTFSNCVRCTYQSCLSCSTDFYLSNGSCNACTDDNVLYSITTQKTISTPNIKIVNLKQEMMVGIDVFVLRVSVAYQSKFSYTSAVYNRLKPTNTTNITADIDFKTLQSLDITSLAPGNYTLNVTLFLDISEFQCMKKGKIYSYNFTVYSNKPTSMASCSLISATFNSKYEFALKMVRSVEDLPVDYLAIATINGMDKTACLPTDNGTMVKCNLCNFLALTGKESITITCQARHKKYPVLGIKESKVFTIPTANLSSAQSANNNIACPYPNLTRIDNLMNTSTYSYYSENIKVVTCPADYCLNKGSCRVSLDKLPICNCTADYLGNRCQYPSSGKKDAQDSLNALINNATDIIKKGDKATTEELQMAAQQLSKTTSYVDLMNSSIIASSTSVLSKISDSKNAISSDDILTVSNNIISYYNRKKASFDNSTTDDAIEALKVINKVSSNAAVDSAKTGATYSRTLSNLAINAQSMSNLNKAVNSSVTDSTNSVSSSITTKSSADQVIVVMKSYYNPLYSNFSDPNIMKQSSNIISIELYDSAGNDIKTDVETVSFTIRVSSSPQVIQDALAKIFKSSFATTDEKSSALEWAKLNNVQCTYLNTYTNKWLSNSCNLDSVSSDLITCKCTHLTDFTLLSNVTSNYYNSILPSSEVYPIYAKKDLSAYRYSCVAIIGLIVLLLVLFVVFSLNGGKEKYFTANSCLPNRETRKQLFSAILPIHDAKKDTKLDVTLQSIEGGEGKENKVMKLNNFIIKEKDDEDKQKEESKDSESKEAEMPQKDGSVDMLSETAPTFGNYFKLAFLHTHFIANLAETRTELSPRRLRALLMITELSIYMMLSVTMGSNAIEEMDLGYCIVLALIPVAIAVIAIPLLAKLLAFSAQQKMRLHKAGSEINKELLSMKKSIRIRQFIGVGVCLAFILFMGAYCIMFAYNAVEESVKNCELIFLFALAIGAILTELLTTLILAITFTATKGKAGCGRLFFNAIEEYRCIRVIS